MSDRIGSYAIEEIAPSVYAIDDDQDESMYLIGGRDRAVMIDTGSSPEPLMPVIRTLYPGPVDLVLTHAHFDHMYHCDEFSGISLHQADISSWDRVLKYIVWISSAGSGKKPKRYPVRSFTALREGDRISLGDKELEVIHAKGHTPGSVILVDKADRILFTGDAYGSGDYAWMWMPGCSCLSEYRESLDRLAAKLLPYRDYRMLGGHRRQGIPSASNPGAKPLTYQTLLDMATLCERILSGQEQPESVERNFGIKNYVYRYGDAGIVLTRGKIR